MDHKIPELLSKESARDLTSIQVMATVGKETAEMQEFISKPEIQ
jgi:hypothetical protein